MFKTTIDNIEIEAKDFEPDEKEIRAYIYHVAQHESVKPENIQKIGMELSGRGGVRLVYQYKGQGFERIRRITGYLVGTIDRWNDAKQAEERDRVKHA